MLSGTQQAVLFDYIVALGTKTINHWVFAPAVFVIGTVVIVLLVLLASIPQRRYQIPVKTALVALTAGMTLCLFLIGFAYLFVIAPEASAYLGGFERYVGSGVLAGVVATVYLWVYHFDDLGTKVRKLFGTLFIGGTMALTIAVTPILGAEIFTNLDENSRQFDFYWYGHYALMDTVDFDNDKVYVVIQDFYRPMYTRIRYYSTPLRINGPIHLPYDPKNIPDTDDPVFNIQGDVQDWAHELISEEYDYVYLAYINPLFVDIYGTLFEPSAEIMERVLYKVVMLPDDQVVLRPIASPPNW